MIRKIGSYTYQIGSYWQPSSGLFKYIEMLVKPFIKSKRWWQAPMVNTEFIITIEINDKRRKHE